MLGDLTNHHVPRGMRSLLSNFNAGSVILCPLTEAISLFMNCHRSTGVGRLCASLHDRPPWVAVLHSVPVQEPF